MDVTMDDEPTQTPTNQPPPPPAEQQQAEPTPTTTPSTVPTPPTDVASMDNAALVTLMGEFVRRGLYMPQSEGPKKQKLEKLKTYNGNRQELRGWLLQANAKLQDLAQAGYDRGGAVAYLMNRMEGTALERMTPWLEQHADCEPEVLLKYLESTFGDAHREQTAANKLNNLRQGNKTFRTFVQEFQQLMAEGGDLTASMSEEYRIVALRKGMSDKTYEDAARFAIGSKTLEEYVNNIQAVIDDLDARRLGAPKPAFHAPRLHHDPMDIDRVAAARRAGSTSKVLNNHLKSTSDADAPVRRTGEGNKDQKRVKWVSWEARQERGKKGLCFRCGASGHREAQCPHLPPRRPEFTAKTRYVAPLLEDDSASEDNEADAEAEEPLN